MAFSPTDVSALRPMGPSCEMPIHISLLVAILVSARAINILK